MEILDAQLHPNLILGRQQAASAPELVQATVATMDAVGVEGALLDDWAGYDDHGEAVPGHDLASGIRRVDYPVASYAMEAHPDRFISTIRVHPEDPEIAELMSNARAGGQLALRWFPTPRTGPILGQGNQFDPVLMSRYERYFELAQRNALPIFLVVPDQALLLEPLVRRYADAWFVIDHLGASAPLEGGASPDRFDRVRELVGLARLPNVALKWCHALRWSVEEFPHHDVLQEF